LARKPPWVTRWVTPNNEAILTLEATGVEGAVALGAPSSSPADGDFTIGETINFSPGGNPGAGTENAQLSYRSSAVSGAGQTITGQFVISDDLIVADECTLSGTIFVVD
jgi:hypothetical protein